MPKTKIIKDILGTFEGIGPWQDAWIKTLLSNKFDKTTGVLCLATRNKNRSVDYAFCCLGIACEVALENKFQGITVDMEEDTDVCGYHHKVSYDGEVSALPFSIKNLYGTLYSNGCVIINRFLNLTKNEEDKFLSLTKRKINRNKRKLIAKERVDMKLSNSPREFIHIKENLIDVFPEFKLTALNDNHPRLSLPEIGKVLKTFPELYFRYTA